MDPAAAHGAKNEDATGRRRDDGELRELKALRVYLGLTQAELARRSGLSREEVGNIERGRHVPHPSTMRRLLGALQDAAGTTAAPAPEPPTRPTERPSPIRKARADSLASIARGYGYRGVLRLDKETYEHLSALGLSRSEVAGAVDVLTAENRAMVGVEHGVVTLRLRRGRE